MTNSNKTEDKVTLAEHVADTHHNTPVVGSIVTGDIVGGEVTKNEEQDGDEDSC